MTVSDDDFESGNGKKKPKPSSFTFESSEDSVLPKPKPKARKQSSEDSENQPPSSIKSSKKKSGKKKVLTKLLSFSSEDEMSPVPENPTPSKQVRSATKLKQRTPLATKRPAHENNPVNEPIARRLTPRTRTPTASKTSAANEEPSTQTATAARRAQIAKEAPAKTHQSPSRKEDATKAEAQKPTKSSRRDITPDDLIKQPKPRISIGARGYETILHSPRHIMMSRLSTNSNISSIDLPIAESTALDLEISPSDSYLSRPVFQAVVPQSSSKESSSGSKQSTKSLSKDLAEPVATQDLALELTLTQPTASSIPASKGSKSSSNSVPSSEYRSRHELTQVAWSDNDEQSSDEEGFKTVITETSSDKSNTASRVAGPHVIEESSLSTSKPNNTSSSLFSTKAQGNETSYKSTDKSTDRSASSSSLASHNLSSYVKGKKPRKKTKKKAVKHLLIEPDLSSDEDKEKLVNKDKFMALLEESKMILESIESDDSELPFPLTQKSSKNTCT